MTSTQDLLPQPLVSVFNACCEFFSWAKLVIYRWRNTVGMVSPNSFPAVSSSCNLGGAEKWQRSACKVSTFAAMPHICMGAMSPNYSRYHWLLDNSLWTSSTPLVSDGWMLLLFISIVRLIFFFAMNHKIYWPVEGNCSNSLTCSVHSVTSDTFVHIPAWSKRWQEVNHFSMGGAS